MFRKMTVLSRNGVQPSVDQSKLFVTDYLLDLVLCHSFVLSDFVSLLVLYFLPFLSSYLASSHVKASAQFYRQRYVFRRLP